MTWVVLRTDSTTDISAKLGYWRNRILLVHSASMMASRAGVSFQPVLFE